MTAAASLKPRKSPRQSRSAQTVEAILEGAARILETRGFDGYTTNAVAERAGVSIGSLYQYFPGKDALTRALIRRETGRLLAEAAPFADLPDADRALEGVIGAAVAHQLRRPTLARLLDVEEARLPVGDDVEAVSAVIVGTLGRILDRSDLPGAASPEAVHDVLAIIKGMVDAAGQRDERDPAALRGRVRKAVFGYLAL
jgi:AcrR family transcriptional regulator